MIKMTSILIIATVVIALIYATPAGLFVVAELGLPTTNYWLTFIIGYAFISVIAKIVGEIFSALYSFYVLIFGV